MSNAFLIMGLTRRVSQFNEDRKNNIVSVETLDNIREICFHVEQIFEINKETIEGLHDICHKCLVAYDHMTPNFDEKEMLKRINAIRFGLLLELKSAKINIFQRYIMVLLVIKSKEKGVLSVSEYPSIKVAEKEYKKLFPDTFDEITIIEATEYMQLRNKEIKMLGCIVLFSMVVLVGVLDYA